MRRNLTLAFVLFLVATTGFAQSRLTGKWATDKPPDPLPLAPRPQTVRVEVTIEDGRASGTITLGGLGGTFHTFKGAKVTGNKIMFRVDPPKASDRSWAIEMVDDNTVMLYRGDLPLITDNVLDLIAVLGGSFQPAPAIPVAQAGANDSIKGIVQDANKALIPGATVTATNVSTGAKLTILTDNAGRYAFPSAIPGKYTMTASVKGFQTTTVSNLDIGDTQLVQNFILELPTPWIGGNPTAATCGEGHWPWCVLLHRAK